jgi:hypothetical protein
MLNGSIVGTDGGSRVVGLEDGILVQSGIVLLPLYVVWRDCRESRGLMGFRELRS